MADDLIARLLNPPFGTETSERNLMKAAADRIEALTCPADINLDDLVDRLRHGVARTGEGPEGIEMFDVDDANGDMWEAADAITSLRNQIAALLRDLTSLKEHETALVNEVEELRAGMAAAVAGVYEAAARIASSHAKYTREAIKNATVQALVANVVTVSETRTAHFIEDKIRALTPADAIAARDARDNAEFNRGYVIACCNLVNLHDQPSIAFDVLAQLNIAKADVGPMDLSEYDTEALLEIERARGSSSPYARAVAVEKGEA